MIPPDHNVHQTVHFPELIDFPQLALARKFLLTCDNFVNSQSHSNKMEYHRSIFTCTAFLVFYDECVQIRTVKMQTSPKT